MTHLRFIGRALHVKNSMNLFRLGLYHFLSDNVTRVFDLRLTEIALINFAFEANIGQALCQVFLKAALCHDEKIVNELSNAFDVVKELTDLVLEIVRGDTHTHWKSIVFVLAKWSDDCK